MSDASSYEDIIDRSRSSRRDMRLCPHHLHEQAVIDAHALPSSFARSGRVVFGALNFWLTLMALVWLDRTATTSSTIIIRRSARQRFPLHGDGSVERVVVGLICARVSAFSCSFPATLFILRGFWGADAGFLAQAPNGRASPRRMSKSAISIDWRQNIPALRLRSGP